MTMEEMIEKHEQKETPVIKKPEFLRYKFKEFKRNPNIFISSNDRHLEWEYWHSFSIFYLHEEVDYFSKEKGWYLREKKILIPKIVNNILKYCFGKRYYSIGRTYDECCTYHTEMVDLKTKNNYIQEFKEEGCTDIYISMKEIRYSGWLWITKKENKTQQSLFDSMVNLWSRA